MPGLRALRWLAELRTDARHGRRLDVLVIGGGPAGLMAALRAADLGARTTLVTSDAFGGMAAHDGPVPVRTLAHAARLMRDARQLGDMAIAVGAPTLDYAPARARARGGRRGTCATRPSTRQIEAAGVTVHENVGRRASSVRTPSRPRAASAPRRQDHPLHRRRQPAARRPRVRADRDAQRRLEPDVGSPDDAGDRRRRARARRSPRSSTPSARRCSSRGGPRILATEDEDVSAASRRPSARRHRGARGLRVDRVVREDAGRRPDDLRQGRRAELGRGRAGRRRRRLDGRDGGGWPGGRRRRDRRPRLRARRCSPAHLCAHVFAAGDVTGRLMLVPQAVQDGFVAATNAVGGSAIATATRSRRSGASPIPSTRGGRDRGGGAQTAMSSSRPSASTRRRARSSMGERHGFCKLIVDRQTRMALGATSSATAPSTSCRRRPSSSRPGCGWTTSRTSRSRSRLTRAFSAEQRRWRRAS